MTTTLTTEDIRGGSPSALGDAIAKELYFDFADAGGGVTGENVDGVGQYTAADGIFRYMSTGTDGADALGRDAGTPHTLTTQLKLGSAAGATVGTARTTEITSNGVATLTTAVDTGQSDNVKVTGGTVKVRPGTSDVMFTAKAMDNAGTPAPVANATVTFTLTAGAGIALTDLTANGAAVPASGEVTVTTGADGMAKLTVRSAKTADANAYTVNASSGAANATPALSVAYQAAAVDAVKITSTSTELTPKVGTTSVTVKGKLVDQFGKDFQPPASENQQVAVSGDATGNAVLSNGTFSYTYTPTTPPAAGTTNSLTFTYGARPPPQRFSGPVLPLLRRSP